MGGVLLLPPLFKGRIKSLGDVRVGMTEQVQQRAAAWEKLLITWLY